MPNVTTTAIHGVPVLWSLICQEGWPDPTELPCKHKKGHRSAVQLSLPRTRTNTSFWSCAKPRMRTGNTTAGQGVTAHQCAESESNETARKQADIMKFKDLRS